jgi:hypothetical protein
MRNWFVDSIYLFKAATINKCASNSCNGYHVGKQQAKRFHLQLNVQQSMALKNFTKLCVD